MKKLLILLFAFLCTTLLCAQDGRRTVAVVPASGVGIPESVKEGVTEGLLEGVVNSGLFRAVARGADFQNALGEMQFQQSGNVADDQLIEFGRALRADFVAFAVISKFDESHFRITYRMVDVATGEIPVMSSEMIEGSGLRGLMRATDNISQKLFGSGGTTGSVGAAPSMGMGSGPAKLHIYRPRRLGGNLLPRFDVLLDNSVIARPANNWKTTVTVNTFGPKTLSSKLDGKAELRIDIAPGGVYYIRCDISSQTVNTGKRRTSTGRDGRTTSMEETKTLYTPVLQLVDESIGAGEFNTIK
ncbi:MAG: hypothetical protein FWE63_03980 [Bacteroidales bacterium]|nr:hypothetical protein [Bacteroidales bacterium]